ncbi:RNA polymerase sigma-70 factor [Myxococcus stipitatus DSM 14675]|uniref:RNA polymerase sigma-70 factor n=2 Tax=Myxococcus stipitatus TaxID=83455 RepID=L7UDZ0_MYXSD|nr:RNA polymerase sigma-70 factor [Myxococcus stipitatus DSM 14675]
MRYPTRAEQEALHARVLKGRADPTAPDDVHRAFNDKIISVLRDKLRCSQDEAIDSTVDAVITYLKEPKSFDARIGPLSTYLTHIAKQRARDRLRTRTKMEIREQKYAADFALGGPAPNGDPEATVEAHRFAARLGPWGFTPKEQKFLWLSFTGESSTERLAEALDLAPMSKEERQREVKRHQDRLKKRLARYGREAVDVIP